MPFRPLTTQIVGSYRKPHWLARHQRMRALDASWWRPEEGVLQEAKEDAVRLAIYEQERAGLDLLTDGEAQRPSYDRYFLSGLSNIDTANLEQSQAGGNIEGSHRDTAHNREYNELSALKPVVTGDIAWSHPVSVEELQFLKANTEKPVKTALVGPVTLSAQLVDSFYGDAEALVMALAGALNNELRALEAAGADVIQIDEPGAHFNMDLVRAVGNRSIARMVEGVAVPVIVHVCYGYALVYTEKSPSPTYPELLEIYADAPVAAISIEYEQPNHGPEVLRHCGDKHVVLGLLDLGNEAVETPEHIAQRLDDAMTVVPPERLHPASDCGMWYLPHDVAFGKIRALVQGTGLVRSERSGMTKQADPVMEGRP